MSKTHSKKRNVGLIREFLVRSIASALVEGDEHKSTMALKIVKRFFKPGTELHREYRLVNALVTTTVSSELTAASIIQEAKTAARAYDVVALDREKSQLIAAINHGINDADFYDQQVNEYKIYATVQTLLNDWRVGSKDLGRTAIYEDQLLRWLVTEKVEVADTTVSNEAPGTGRLLMRVMMRKLNEKYAGVLSEGQKRLVRAYAFSTANDDPSSIRAKLEETRVRLVADIDAEIQGNPTNEYVNAKLSEAKQRILDEALDTVDDATVTRFMLYVKLHDELMAPEEMNHE